MVIKKKWKYVIVLFVVAILIRLFSADRSLAERYYSTGIYPHIAIFFRWLAGWVLFSLGDILYSVTALWLLWKIGRLMKMVIKRRFTWLYFLDKLSFFITVILMVYISFNLLWGINYNRLGIASQLGITVEKYSTTELKNLTAALLQKVNESKTASLRNSNVSLNNNDVFKHSKQAYAEVNKKFSFLRYNMLSVKTSLLGWLGNYMGFNGYYNPFTGEAQVNTTVPRFLLPYIACHEMAHQLGYAKENEANFVGYLAATASKDSSFLYSTYFDLFLYADRDLYSADSAAARSFAHQLIPAVKADIKEWNNFSRSHQSPAEPVIRWLYGKFLQSNQQPSGVLSYDEVTGLLIAYYKKYGVL